MSEIITPPIVTRSPDGDMINSFGPHHTWRDVVRWIISEGGRDEVSFYSKEQADG